MTTEPRVYVGTYAKYNNGSIKGDWLTISNYSDREKFYEAAAKLHADEHDPEFMFQDYEGFPKTLYSESHISDALIAFANLDDSDRGLLAVYMDEVDSGGDIDAAREAFHGCYDSPEDWAADWLEEVGALDSVPEGLRNYIDFKAYARDAEMDGTTFVRHNGNVWVFRQ